MHHDDYTRPLDITWLCGRCHRRRHRENVGWILREGGQPDQSFTTFRKAAGAYRGRVDGRSPQASTVLLLTESYGLERVVWVRLSAGDRARAAEAA